MVSTLRNSIYYYLYFIYKLTSFRLLIGIVLGSILVTVFLIFTEPESGKYSVRFLSSTQSTLAINGLSSFAIPIYFFLFLFMISELTAYNSTPDNIRNLFAFGLSRYSHLITILLVIIIICLSFSFAVLISAAEFIHNNQYKNLAFYLLIAHLILSFQIYFLSVFKLRSASLLIIYILFFLIFPSFFSEILKAILITSENQLFYSIHSFIEYLFGTHFQLLSDLGKIASGKTTSIASSSPFRYLGYALVLFMVYSISTIKRDY